MNVCKPILSRLRSLLPKKSMKIYKDFEEAQLDSHTYEDPSVIQVVFRKTEAFRNTLRGTKVNEINNRQTLQNLFVLSLISRDKPLEVLELGGACGASYLELNQLLPGKMRRWNIVETPAMAEAGKNLFQDGCLAFYSDFEKAIAELESCDLLIAQGVLQYLRDPLQTIEQILGLGFANIYITRTIISDGFRQPIVTKQIVNLSDHGPGPVPEGFVNKVTSQPLTIIPYESLRARISNGYNILYSFDEGQSNSIRAGSQTVRTRMIGFFLKKVDKDH